MGLSVSALTKGVKIVAQLVKREFHVSSKLQNPITEFIKKSGSTTITLEELNKMAAKNKVLKSSVVRAQSVPTGVVKQRLDLTIANYKAHINRLKEERIYFKGSNEEFSKRLESLVKELKVRYPEYAGYISQNIGI